MVSDSSTDIIELLVEDHKALMALIPLQEVSIRSRADASFAKTLLLAAASYFETRMTEAVIDVFRTETNQEALVDFVRRTAVSRRYHDWFDWTARNANKFIGAFGSDFKEYIDEWARSHQESIRSFLEIGSSRNELVHENFAVFSLSKTVDDIFDLYQEALVFVDGFPQELRNYLQRSRTGS